MALLSQTFGQPLKEVPLYMLLEVAEERLEAKDYYNALDLYEQAYKEERNDEVAYKIAQLHYKLRDFKRAERWYRRVTDKDESDKWPEAIFDYARILKMNGKFQDAIDVFNYYANIVQADDKLAKADLEVAGIQMAVNMKQPIELVIENLGRRVNSSYSDFAPHYTAEGDLYFSAMDSKEVIFLNGEEGDYHSKVYTTSLDTEKNRWDKPKALKKINREGFHTGNVTISDDASVMYFTRALMDGNELQESAIYFSTASNKGNWTGPNPVSGINGNHIATHPAVGDLFGTEVLFFSSDQDGGEGGFDIYYATKRGDGEFGLPVNLGPTINTPGDEVTPFYLNNVLYFSSDGHPSLGGFDIVSADWDGAQWAKPRNMGMGYNSTFDDLYFTVKEEGKKGFLVSNRISDETRSVKSKTCCDDIYSFDIRDIVIDLLALVYDGNVPLEGASVTLSEMEGNTTGKSRTNKNDSGNDFNFLLDMDKSYKAIVERDGYFPAEFEFNTVGLIDDHTIERLVRLEKAPESESETEIITINEPIRLNNIYYDFDDDKILTDAEKDLSFLLDLLDQYDDMEIELSSHTDAQGGDSYNQRLSQRRAQSAKNWLVDRGVDSDRIEAIGYGEEQILNRCVNGVNCSDDEHRFNRRTEFKIIAGPTSIEIKKEVLGGSEKKN